MKLTDIETALWAAIEIAMTETGKTKAADAIRANAGRIETKTATHNCELYKTPNGNPVFKATPLSGGAVVNLNGFKLIQKVSGLEGKASGSGGAAAANSGSQMPRTDSAERNRSVGLMRRKSG
ncbi:MAG TPA: hypothetical protein VF719_00430 [Abditibacteriaceae bacterium]|jgi:hypothetical protein